MTLLVEKYPYQELSRESINGKRLYDEKLDYVTDV